MPISFFAHDSPTQLPKQSCSIDCPSPCLCRTQSSPTELTANSSSTSTLNTPLKIAFLIGPLHRLAPVTLTALNQPSLLTARKQQQPTRQHKHHVKRISFHQSKRKHSERHYCNAPKNASSTSSLVTIQDWSRPLRADSEGLVPLPMSAQSS